MPITKNCLKTNIYNITATMLRTELVQCPTARLMQVHELRCDEFAHQSRQRTVGLRQFFEDGEVIVMRQARQPSR